MNFSFGFNSNLSERIWAITLANGVFDEMKLKICENVAVAAGCGGGTIIAY